MVIEMSERDVETELRLVFKAGSKIDVEGVLFEVVKVEGANVLLWLDEYSPLWCKNCHPDWSHGRDCDECIHNYNSSVNVGNH